MMKQLAKVGFTQSYSYFTWRNTKPELTEYLTELTAERAEGVPAAELLRQHAGHQSGLPADQRAGRLSGAARAAATLSSVYGIYNGFELCERRSRAGRSTSIPEKYEIKAWDYDRLGNIRDYVAG